MVAYKMYSGHCEVLLMKSSSGEGGALSLGMTVFQQNPLTHQKWPQQNKLNLRSLFLLTEVKNGSEHCSE